MRKILLSISLLFLLSSCVNGLNKNQERKLSAVKYDHPELYQKEKNEGVGAALGLLPGGGSFYTRNYAVGAVNLLLWPLSILWDPFNGINGSKEINYYSTLQNVKRKKNKELDRLKMQYAKGKISDKNFTIKKMEIESEYDLDKNL